VRSGNQDINLDLNTVGGETDVARRMTNEVRQFQQHCGQGAFCIGKSYVCLAGVTILAAFPKRDRDLTTDAVLLIQEGRIRQSLELVGPMFACIQIVRESCRCLRLRGGLKKMDSQGYVEGAGFPSENYSSAPRPIATCRLRMRWAMASSATSWGKALLAGGPTFFSNRQRPKKIKKFVTGNILAKCSRFPRAIGWSIYAIGPSF
jgi:hypothetical protein